MALNKKHVLVAFLFLALVFIESALLALSGAELEVLTGFNIGAIISVLFSAYFIGFALLLPLPHALAAVLSKKFEKKDLFVSAIGGTAVGALASIALFPALSGYWFACALYIASFFFAIEIAYIKREELKKWVWLRTLNISIGKGLTITAIGVLVATLLFAIPNNEKSEQAFEDEMFSMTIGESSGMENLGDAVAGMLIENQKQTLKTVTANQLFKKLEGKEDVDVQLFVAAVSQIENQLDTAEYRETVEKQIESGMSSLGDKKQDFKKAISEQVPLFNLIKKWLWLIQAIAVFGLFALYKGIIATPLGIAYGLMLEKAIK